MKAFSEIRSSEAFEKFKVSIKNEIEGKSKQYILGVDENEFKNYLIGKYKLDPLSIFFDREIVDEPVVSTETLEDRFREERYLADVYYFKVSYPFDGSASIFRLYPTRRAMTSYDITVDESSKTVSYAFKLHKQSPEEFFREKESAKNNAFVNLENANNDVKSWNTELEQLIHSYFSNQKSKFERENNFFAAINIPIDKSTQIVFTPPTIKRKDIPQPILNSNQEFSSEPVMSKKMYDDILQIIYDAGKGMERKPSLYIGRDEEALRDIFLLLLETRYDAITATSETFNRSGKTDIILKYAKDGTNLFVAECKFWHGFKGFLDTITQLFDRYLTWRDSKVAVMIFVSNDDFTSVLKNIATEVRNHPYYVRDNGHRGESSFSYIFHLKQDQNKSVQLEVIAFHFDKK